MVLIKKYNDKKQFDTNKRELFRLFFAFAVAVEREKQKVSNTDLTFIVGYIFYFCFHCSSCETMVTSSHQFFRFFFFWLRFKTSISHTICTSNFKFFKNDRKQ